jgi:DNA uptake protein ComE-like DNA-binding protein
MESQNSWKWLLAMPVINWLGLLVAGQQARKPAWVRWGIIYAALSSLSVGAGLLSGEWVLFWLVWLEVAVHSYRVQGEYQQRIALINNPQLRLQSEQDLQTAQDLGFAVDVNRASIDDLLRLPGMSIIEARRIVEERRRGGNYLSPEELHERADISATKLKRLAPLLLFCYYEPATMLPVRLAVNRVSAEQLTQLEGIDAVLAERIVRERDQGGDYRNLEDLRTRLTLSPALVAALLNRLDF